MANDKLESKGPKFHQIFYGCAVVVALLWELAASPDRFAYALGKTTFDALLLAFLVFGWAWCDAKLFSRSKKKAE